MVTFQALIKQLTIKSLVSMDKNGRLLLEFCANEDEPANKINSLMKADQTVTVIIKESTDDNSL